MTPPPFGLPPQAVAKINAVLALHPAVEKAILYGSRARGNYKNGSDIDLTLRGEGLEHREMLEIADQLDDLLLPYTIDLSLMAKLNHPELLDHIRRVGVVFYTRQLDETSPT